MLKRVLFVIISWFVISGSVFAQGLNGETEIGTDGKGEGFFSQYVFYDWSGANVLIRYLWVNGVIERGELAIGPTFDHSNSTLPKDSVLKMQVGITTASELMFAGLFTAKINGREILYKIDFKVAPVGDPNTLYQKFFVSLKQGGALQFRVEGLLVDSVHDFLRSDHGFLRIGLEYRRKLPVETQLFVAPYFDPVREGVGGHLGVRFF